MNKIINKLEQDMRDQAVALASIFDKICELDEKAAEKAIDGAIEYLKEKRNEPTMYERSYFKDNDKD